MPGELEIEPMPTVSLVKLVDLLIKKIDRRKKKISFSYGRGVDIKVKDPDFRQAEILENIAALRADLGTARTAIVANPGSKRFRATPQEVLGELTDLLNQKLAEQKRPYRYPQIGSDFSWRVFVTEQKMSVANFQVQDIWFSNQPLPEETCVLFQGASILERPDFSSQKVRFLPVTYLCKQVK